MCVCVCVCVCVYKYVYIYTYTNMYIYIYAKGPVKLMRIKHVSCCTRDTIKGSINI